MFIKFFTSPTFNRKDFASLLRYKMNVRACEIEGGVILDLDAFKLHKPADMPYWVFINRKHILSPLRTRPATPEEVNSLLHPARFALYVCSTKWEAVTVGDDLGYMCALLDGYKKATTDRMAIVDTTTGEIVHE